MTFTDTDLREMRDFEARVDDANADAMRSESERFPPVPGGMGRFLRGPMQGQEFPVIEVSDAEVVLLMGSLRMKARKMDVRNGGLTGV